MKDIYKSEAEVGSGAVSSIGGLIMTWPLRGKTERVRD